MTKGGGEPSDMPIRLKTERRLQQGFQKYIHKQYRKYASQHRQAVTLATLFRLGELQGIFALKQESVRETIGGMLFLLLLVCSIFGVPVVFIEKGVHPSGVIIAHSVLFLAFLSGGLVLSCLLWMRPPRYLWLYAFADGLAVGSPQSIEQNIIRWNDVTDIRSVWNNRFNPVSEESEPRLTAYQLSLYDGRTVAIPSTMQNMLDPYPNVGRMISALVPTSVAQTIPRFPVIDEIIQQHLPHHDQPGVQGGT